MSRVTKSIKNAKVGVFFFVISIFVQFFSRKIFLDFLGDEFIGLTSTLRSILGFLNLAELGIGTAVGYALYKPIFDKNHKEINNIIALLSILYKRIGLIILGLSVLLSLFFPLIFSEVSFQLGLIYTAFYSFLFSALMGYFINYHMVLLEADQKSYIVQGYFQSSNIIRLILQSLIAYYFQSFYVWILLEVFFSIIYSIVLRIKVKQQYQWLKIHHKENGTIIKQYPEVVKKIKQLFVHKMGAFVKDGTDNILVFALVSIESVAFFGNYQLIFMKLTSLVKIAFAGTSAGVGNLVAENDKENIRKVFWEMVSMQFFIGGFLSICLYYLVVPFIILWVGEIYVLDNRVLIIMIAVFFIGQIRGPVDFFKNAYGLFSDTWAPAAEVVINLIISFIFGKLWGISGIMLGTLISLSVIVLFWKPYFLYKNGFKQSVFLYWKGFIPLALVFLIAASGIYFVFNDNMSHDVSGFLQWVFLAIKLCAAISVLYGILLYLFIPGFRDLCLRAKHIIQRKISH